MTGDTTTPAGPPPGEAMTESRPAKRARWSRGQIRLLAWVSGSAAFLTVAGIVGVSPKPAAAKVVAPARSRPVVQRVIIRRIIRRVVIVDAPKPTSPAYFSPPTYSTPSGGGGAAVSAPIPAPVPQPPPVSTGGSAPPP